MILQALVRYYEVLAARGEISLPGWCDAKVSYALHIDESGELLRVFSLKQPSADGKKEVPQQLRVPEQVKKTSGVDANFLCENSSYLLGVDNKGKPARSLACFSAARSLHEELLSAVNAPAARAVCAYFARWEPERALEHPALAGAIDDILKGANLVFWADGGYVQEDAAVRAAWESRYAAKDTPSARCLVTGEVAPVAVLHPSIKGVRGAQSSGASLVSFNADAFESYGKEQRDKTGQGRNSPVSEKAAFAYGTALNYLLADREHVQYIGDTAVVYWAEDGGPVQQDIFAAHAFGTPPNRIGRDDLERTIHAVVKGEPVDIEGIPLNPENRFYVLGIAPNAARLSVRLFLQNSFSGFLRNIAAHYKRMELVKPGFETMKVLPVWHLLNETVNQKAQDKKAAPPLAAAMLRAILQNTRYPASLYTNLMLRINAEREVTWKKAAVIKAYLLKNEPDRTTLKEELTLPIEYKEEGPAFVLGCLLALLEKIQEEAIDNINQTLVDKFLSTACATPAQIFDSLLEKSEYHLRKKKNWGRQRELENLLSAYHAMSPSFPEHLDHVQRGDFMVGYYMKHQELWTKKAALNKEEEKEYV